MAHKAVPTSFGVGSGASFLAHCGRSVAFALRLVFLTIVFLVLKAFFTLFRR